jgi:cytochrome P450
VASTLPGPGRVRALARVAALRGDTPRFFLELQRRHGDAVRIGNIYFLFHPDEVRRVLETEQHHFQRVAGERRVSGRLVDDALFASEDPQHAQQREVMEPVMYGHAPEALAGAVSNLAGWMRDTLRDGQEMDLFAWTEATTTQEVVRLLFGLDPTDPRGKAMADAIRRTIDAMDHMFLGFSGIPDRLPPLKRKFAKARRELDGLVGDVVRAERATPGRNDNVASMLAQTGLADADIRNELLTLFRGHQAVSTSLCWTFFQLASLPEIERRLHEEVDEVTGGDVPGPEHLDRLDYTRRVFQESLRLLPPAWVLARRAVHDHPVNGSVVPEGAQVLVSEWVTHRDARWWPQPDRFDPDRFLPQAEAERPEYAYFPQGGGPKMCMGKHLVVPVEGPLLLAAIAGRWRMRLAEGFRVEFAAKATLKPKKGVRMVVQARS